MNFKKFFIYTEPSASQQNTLRPSRVKAANSGINAYIKNNIRDKSSFTYKSGKVSRALSENKAFLNDAFETEKNFDLVIRDFRVKFKTFVKDAFLIFYDGLVNADYINRDILNPLMVVGIDKDPSTEAIEHTVFTSMLSQAPNDRSDDMEAIIEAVGFGNCAVFVDGCANAFIADVKGWDGRGVERPVAEAVLTGPQEAFTEKIMTNIGLIRKILKDPNLIAEKISVGTKSKTPCALMYINGITNISLVKEARRRLTSIETEYIFSSADIEMLIEESTAFPLPQLLKSERPDRVAANLADGKVAIIVQGSPFVLILPATAADLLESAEDNYVRIAEANFMRAVRFIGCFLALFLSGIFIAVVLYHHDSIPTDLLFAIEASRKEMPFPILSELLLMIISFELIKEASVRIPDSIGSTLGIVGGLILGQSAVSAGIASPLLIIIVSLSALGAFAAPSASVSRALSVMQFIFIFLGAAAGFLGIAFGIFVLTAYLSSEKSFGIPYISSSDAHLIIPPIWRREKRPSDLLPQQDLKQPHISRKWKGASSKQ